MLLVPSLSWGDEITLDCTCYKTESKLENKVMYNEIMIFNGLYEPRQTIVIKFDDIGPSESNISIKPEAIFNLKMVNDTMERDNYH